MRYVLTIVEQLDRAASELANDHPINNRLALILIDNATELILHRQCTDRLERDSEMSGLQAALLATAKSNSMEAEIKLPEDLADLIMTPRQRANAKGKFFDDMLKVLKDMGDLTQSERGFIKIAHDYRNELYHVGLAHDDIIRAIAGHYFLLCCDLFARMGKLSIFGPSFSSNDEYTDVARRYIPMRDGWVDLLHVDNGVLAEKLRCARPDGIPDLAKTLGGSARKSIQVIMDDFEFLIRNNPFGFSADEMLEVAQWQLDLTHALECEDVNSLWVDPNYREGFTLVATALKATWEHRHSSIPRERWMLRASAVEREADPLIAMSLYQSLRNDMSYLEEAVQSAAGELDGWIQMEIDKVRGK